MKHWQIIGYWLVATGWLLGCGEKKAPPLFERLYNTGIQFTNTVSNSKDMNIFTYRNFYNGGGVGIGDLNNDSLPDVFMTGNMGPNKLFFNKGNFVFEEVSAKAGIRWQGEWSTGVVMVDINGDGWLDLYVCNAGQEKIRQGQANRLYINNRNGTFTDSAQAYGLAETGYTTHASFFDYDLDGDLDCYILNNSFIPVNTLNYANKRDLKAQDWPVADFLKGGGDKLLRNDSGHFTDVTEKAGIYSSLIGFGLGITTGDINGDGYPDLYVSNDFFERDYLYINNRDGTFREELENRVQHLSLASMGADIADVNNDGFPDIFTTDMLPDDEVRLKTTASFDNIDDYNRKVELGFYRQFMQNTLQVNDRNGNFLETAYYSGVAGSDWSWGGLIFDADNDGLSDLYVCNGIYHDVTDQDFINFLADEVNQRMAMTGKKEEVDSIINKMPTKPILNKAFKNRGNLSFSDEGLNWGFTEPSFSNGAAYADLDNDGDLDMVINNVNQPAFVYRNNSRQQNPYHYISLLLRGQGANTFAIGSHIKVYQGGQIISREVIPSRGFQSSVDYRQVIGLGNGQPDSVVVTWPNRSVSVLVRPAVDQLHILQQPNDTPSTRWGIARADSALPLLQPVPSSFDKHNEDGYNDFYYERNIPVMLSREGPRAAMGDVNGDGLTDVYICGAAYQAGQLYLQTPTGGFVKKEQPAFALFANFEDAAAIFFDCDNDRDLDLLVGSGGDSAQANSREIQNRLYRNDGQGNFTLDASALPPNADNCGALAAHDFDGDGDWDLFVGSRCVTNSYGVSPASYLLVNDGKGRFTDATPPTLSKIGMVTSAVWANVVGDAQLELIVVGEWMAPQVWGYNGNTLEPVRNNLGAYSGWWQCVTAADMDGDGDQDLVMGNMGLNFYLRPRADAPVKLFLNDFDGNGSLEKIMTRSIQGRDMPVFMKREMVEQIPSLKKQNLQNKDYAGKAIQDLFAKPLIEKSQLKECRYAASCVAYNQDNGQFAVQDLPPYAQLSCVNAVLCTRLNNDALPDLLIGGNNFNFQPQFGRLDANFGQVLLNSQNGFTWPGNAVGSLHLTGQIKYLGELLVGGQRHFLVLQNNQVPLLYKLRTAVR